jgi:Skp family chaperone for outer membrane proteins
MKKFIYFTFLFFSTFALAQEQGKKANNSSAFNATIGVVDMKKILAQSKAYQSLVDQFENVRRKQRNTFTKQQDIIRDEESELLKKKKYSF